MSNKQRTLRVGEPIPRIIEVTKEVSRTGWNLHLKTPLIKSEKVFVEANQEGVPEGYVRIKHGTPKVVSVFRVSHFSKPKMKVQNA